MRRYIGSVLVFMVAALLAFSGGVPAAADATVKTTGTPLNPPAAPTNLRATFSKALIDLVWQDNTSGVAGFKIERKTGEAGQYAEIKTIGPGVTKFSDSTVQAGASYFYRVKAVTIGAGKEYASRYSNEAALTVPVAQRPFVPVRINAPGFTYVGPKPFVPVHINAPGLNYTGPKPFIPVHFNAPSLNYTGPKPFTPVHFNAPSLNYTGPKPFIPVHINAPSLNYTGPKPFVPVHNSAPGFTDTGK